MSVKNKLVIAMLAGNCEKYIDVALDSVINVADDIIVIYDTSSKDKTIDILKKYSDKIKIINREYEHDLNIKNANSNARNFYLDYLKKNYMGDFCLVLDADEVCDENIFKLKKYLEEWEKEKIWLISPRMKHFIYSLTQEDATVKEHYVLNRLFRIHEELYYPEGEHPVLNTKNKDVKTVKIQNLFIIYHLAYILPQFYILDRYKNHMAKSKIHTADFLNWWKNSHILGTYPVSKLNPTEIPKIILDKFQINKDELYFANRGLEHKHWIDAVIWRDYFKCKTAIEWGCGRGPRVYAMNNIGIDTIGIELSEWAVTNKLHQNIYQGDVTSKYNKKYDLSISYDLLEHISYEKLDNAIETIINSSNEFILVSVPVIGDPNLENDPTHIIKETKEWWIERFIEKGVKSIEVPQNFLFRNQLMIFKK